MNNATESTYTIRIATGGDLEDLLFLLEIMHGKAAKRNARDGEAELLQTILKQPLRRLLVAEAVQGIVGTVDVLVVHNLSRNMAPWATVENLSVDPTMRRRGIGRALMEEAEAYAQSYGCYKIQLISNDARGPAHALYSGLGYNAHVTGFRKYLADVEHV
ncbi:GNAT family N-acetyltransferase [Phytohabitans kaempferiae]|uniref:GNAT family N-acetyltransferase n=1 Tax=Phytohabitans kaempferiae TaxID=1620943 RepID=A0ABV6M8C9_9ACTN